MSVAQATHADGAAESLDPNPVVHAAENAQVSALCETVSFTANNPEVM